MRRAAPVRMRPVLMTAVSMIFGVLPAAIGLRTFPVEVEDGEAYVVVEEEPA